MESSRSSKVTILGVQEFSGFKYQLHVQWSQRFLDFNTWMCVKSHTSYFLCNCISSSSYNFYFFCLSDAINSRGHKIGPCGSLIFEVWIHITFWKLKIPEIITLTTSVKLVWHITLPSLWYVINMSLFTT